jgi:hypothetical protein
VTGALASEVAGLLAEPCPRLGDIPKIEKYKRTPYGRALRMFMSACELVIATNNAEALSDWEQRQARLTYVQTALDSNACFDHDQLSSELESLRQRGRTWFDLTAQVHSALTAVGLWSSTLAADYLHQRVTSEAACAQLEAAARRVLDLKDSTATTSIADVYRLIAEHN